MAKAFNVQTEEQRQADFLFCVNHIFGATPHACQSNTPASEKGAQYYKTRKCDKAPYFYKVLQRREFVTAHP